MGWWGGGGGGIGGWSGVISDDVVAPVVDASTKVMFNRQVYSPQ